MRSGLLFICCMFFLSHIGYTQPNPVKKATEAYYYLVARDYILNQIEKTNPGLARKAKQIRDTFNVTFGKAEKNIEEYLMKNLGEQQTKGIKDKVLQMWREGLRNEYADEEVAWEVMKELEGVLIRKKLSSELITFLIFQYRDNPAGIYPDGFTSVFRTKGRAKAKDTDWQIRVPLGWEASATDMPELIQGFSPPFVLDDVYPVIMMRVMERPGGRSIGEMADGIVKEAAGMPGFRMVSYKPATIQGNPGLVFVSEHSFNKAGKNMKVRHATYLFVRKYKVYLLMGVVGCFDAEKNLKIEMEKYQPMFEQTVNSIVVYDK